MIAVDNNLSYQISGGSRIFAGGYQPLAGRWDTIFIKISEKGMRLRKKLVSRVSGDLDPPMPIIVLLLHQREI